MSYDKAKPWKNPVDPNKPRNSYKKEYATRKDPHIDGVMELADADVLIIEQKLDAIQTAFVPTDEQPVCDIFFIVSTYNKANKGKEINGDTAQSILSAGE